MLLELFPFHAKFNVLANSKFSICYKIYIIFIFYKIQISTNYKKIPGSFPLLLLKCFAKYTKKQQKIMYLEIYEGIWTITFHRSNNQISLKILCIKSWQWQSIAITSLKKKKVWSFFLSHLLQRNNLLMLIGFVRIRIDSS